MRRISVENIHNGDVLARDVFSSTGVILMSTGTKLKTDYVPRLKELRIDDIFIQGEEIENNVKTIEIIEEEIKEQCGSQVRETIQKYTYASNDELKGIIHVADEIMTDIMKQPEVMYNVSCVREKSNELYLHSMNVSAISTLIGLRAKLSKNRVRDIAIGALLHDIGFTTISTSIPEVEFEKCDEKTKKEIMRHVIYGYSELEQKEWLSKISKEIVLQHHERMDGSGYPFHMKGEHISTEVKIVSLCDQFDSMIYGNLMKRYKVNEAMDFIMSQAGVLFDFSIVQLFMESVAAYPIGTIVTTNEGDVAVVVRQNFKFPTRPVIRLLKNREGVAYTTIQEKDLIQCLTLFITDSFDSITIK